MTGRAPLALEVRQLRKVYGASTVLRDVDFDVRPGEIHALLGENGAGKSTLIKILAGVVPRDGGAMLVGGVALGERHTPDEVRRAGVAFVHQDLGLVDALSVAENVALQVGYHRRGIAIDHRRTIAYVDELLQRVGATFGAERLVSSLSRDEKVLCALARAFALDARVIVLDEVSASLPAPELARLSQALRDTRREGVAYVYVTHRLGEVFDLADRVTVLRDGRCVLSASTDEVDPDQVVTEILGAELATQSQRRTVSTGKPALTVDGLVCEGLHAPVSFTVSAGEVLGICGLVGSGTREIARVLVGARSPSEGTVTLAGEQLRLGRPDRLAAAGLASVPGDRQRQGLFAGLSVRENLFPTRRVDASSPQPIVRRPGEERADALALADRFNVRPSGDVERVVVELSGGNQQKVVFARALRERPRVLVLEDPTAGVDVGSRAVLYGLIRDAARDGTAVVLISTDFDEVVAEADRALVLCDGAVTAELRGDDLTYNRLATASYGPVAGNADSSGGAG